jgi:hypothetical protein
MVSNILLLSDVIRNLVKEGYTLDFNTLMDEINNQENEAMRLLPADDFKIDAVYTCEEDERQNNAILVFAISSAMYQLKGIAVNSPRINHSVKVGDMLEQLRTIFIKHKMN